MPCVSPFTTYLYPFEVFCSATCVSNKWESECGQKYHVSICEMEQLTSAAKLTLFGRSFKDMQDGSEDAECLIERIKEIDKTIGDKFLVRADWIERSILRIARLTQAPPSPSLDINRVGLGDTSRSARNFRPKERLAQLAQHFRESWTTKISAKASSSVNHAVSFIAVSYCWHVQDWNVVSSIHDSGKSNSTYRSPISQKMLDAISMLRKDDSEGIWIDQLCINQTESEEKRSAVASMDIIYNAARLVVIVLEDVELSRNDMRVWRRLREQRQKTRAENPQKSFAVPLETARTTNRIITQLLTARWVSRAWCFQEYLVAQRCIFMVPCDGDITVISPTVVQRALGYRRGVSTGPLAATYSHSQGFTYRLYAENGYKSLIDLLVHLNLRHSTFLTDKLSLALNIYGINLAYNGAPLTKDELCYTCIVLALANGDAGFLSNPGPQLELGELKRKSWARWPLLHRLRNASRKPRSESLRVISPFALLTDLYVLEDVVRRPSQSSLDTASHFFQTKEAAALLEGLTLGFRNTSEHFISSLATALDCGLDYILTVCQINDQSFGSKRPGWKWALRETTTLSKRVLQLLMPEIIFKNDHVIEMQILAERVLEFVLILLAFELPLGALTRVSNVSSAVACTPGPPGTIVAVPDGLTHPELMLENRLWFLTPDGREDGKSWRIVGHGLLFAPTALGEAEGLVIVRKAQRIVG